MRPLQIRRMSMMSVLGILALAPPAAAQSDTTRVDTLPRYLLEGFTVTARRSPALRATLPQQVEVVTSADLERTVATTVTGALRRNAAVDVIEYPGLLSGVSVRGFRPQFSGINPRTLILLDGRPAGASNLSTIDLAAVERVEVLKGPASALYGSGAMGGAINIVTRRSSGPLHGSVDGRYGSFGSYRGELRVGGGLAGALDFDLAFASEGRGDGYRTGARRTVGGSSVEKTLASGAVLHLTDAVRDTTLAFSEYSTRSGSLRLGYALAERWRVDARGGFFRGDRVQNPGDLNVTAYSTRTLNDLDRYTGEVALSGQLRGHSLTLRGYSSREGNGYYDDPDEPAFVSSRSPSRWSGAQFQDVIAFGAHTLTAGMDYAFAEERSEVFSARDQAAPPYAADAAIGSAAAFAEGRLALLDGRLTATLGGRLDRISFEVGETVLFDASRVAANTESHTVFNPSAGLVYLAPGGVRAHASAGRAFVTPSAFNVAGYSERSAGARAVLVTRGNPELRPETSVSWDAGLGTARTIMGLDADLTYFHTEVRDRIAVQPVVLQEAQLTPAGDTVRTLTTYVNADRASIRGVEGTLGYDLGAHAAYAWSLRLFASATKILRAEETTGERTTDIRNVADLTTVFGLDYDDMERLGARLTARYVGERLDSDFSDWRNPGDVRYPAHLVVDLSTSLRLADRYRLTFDLANLTDENYYEVRGYQLPGRSLLLGVGVGF